MSFNVQYPTMSPVLPFDITALIIDIVGENKDTNLLKELALVSHSFHQICSKHLFATVVLRDLGWGYPTSSKKRFLELVKSRPNVVNYIRKLTYKISLSGPGDDYNYNYYDQLLSPILSNFLPTTSRLNYLAINCSYRFWNALDSSQKSAFFHLMCLPTINHIDLSDIRGFPLSSLTRTVNLHRLDITSLSVDRHKIVVESEMPKIREFSIIDSDHVLLAKMQDGRPAFNFMNLIRLWMQFEFDDEQHIRYLLQNAKLLERLHLSVVPGQCLIRLHDILSPIARTLKVLSLTISTYYPARLPLAGLCKELEAMAGHYMLEVLSIEFDVERDETEDSIGSNMQKVEEVLVKPGWSALRHVSFKVSTWRSEKLSMWPGESLQCLPDKYLSHLLNLSPSLSTIQFPMNIVGLTHSYSN